MTARPLALVRTLDDRIAAAFEDGATSTDVADLIREAKAASVAAGEASDAARQRALDPRLSPARVAEARREMDDAAFSRDRLQEAVRRLGERLKDLQQQEERARRRADRARVVAERDALAAELAEVYPPLSEQLADLAARIAANDAERQRLSDGIVGAESKARGFSNSSSPLITEAMRLPAFKCSGDVAYAWPRR